MFANIVNYYLTSKKNTIFYCLIQLFYLFLYASGDIPDRCLKKLVMALWSLKLRCAAISPIDMSVWVRRLHISLYTKDVACSLMVDPLISFTTRER